MLRCGKVCRECTQTKCVDKSTPEEPLEVECPECHGKGCEDCEDGWITFQGCPNEYASEMFPAIELIDIFRQGVPPVAGGALDQTPWFLQAVRQLRADENALKVPE